MKIGLYNLEPNIFNTAMMQVSYYHKQKGDDVETYSPLFHDKYDKVYAFSIFSFTKKQYIRKGMICGGTGFNIHSKLPSEIEASPLDYSIFPKCKTSYIWFSRGCIRKCPFCVVPKKEGMIYSVKPKNLNKNGKWITVMDNNFFANPKWKEAVKWLKEKDQPVDFQGVDIRILNDDMVKSLLSLRHYKQIKIAWDNPRENLLEKIKWLIKYIPSWKIMCYVLIGYHSTPREDLYRIIKLKKINVDPFVMPFNKFDKYQMKIARWVNRYQIFKTISFRKYVGDKYYSRCIMPGHKYQDKMERLS